MKSGLACVPRDRIFNCEAFDPFATHSHRRGTMSIRISLWDRKNGLSIVISLVIMAQLMFRDP